MTLLDCSHDRFHRIDSPGGYEWTYFDGMSDDGLHGFTAIWFRGLPMSPYYTAAIDGDRSRALPSRYCGFAFNLYEDGRTIATTFDEGDEIHFDGSESSPDVRFGTNRLSVTSAGDDLRTFSITIDCRTPFLGHRVNGTISGSFQTLDGVGLPFGSFDPTGGDYWAPVGPAGEYRSDLTLHRTGRHSRPIRSTGRLYHDRNIGISPLHENDVHWHWGRVHFGGRTAIYYAIEPVKATNSMPPFHSMILLEASRVVRSISSAALTVDTRPHWTGLPYPRTLTMEGEGADLTSRTLGLLHSGPFYHRMRSSVVLEWDGERLEGIGISEYLRPSRLGVGFFRPFIACRVRREVGWKGERA